MYHFKAGLYPCVISAPQHGSTGRISQVMYFPFCKKIKPNSFNFLVFASIITQTNVIQNDPPMSLGTLTAFDFGGEFKMMKN